MSEHSDPVLERRRRIGAWANTGQKLGYGLYVLSLAAFLAGLATGFGTVAAVVATIALIAGSVILAPAIIVGYGVRAADRADREQSW